MLKKSGIVLPDQAAPNGLRCTACRKAIVRLLAIREDERIERGESDPLEEIVMYPERTKSTTFGRLARDGAVGGDGQTQLMEVQAHMRERHAARGIIYEWLFGALGWAAIYSLCR